MHIDIVTLHKGESAVKCFCFYILSLKKYRNLLVHYNNNGLVAREHGNTNKSPHNRTAFSDIQGIIAFIERLAEIHALPLPGRMPNHKDEVLLISLRVRYTDNTSRHVLRSLRNQFHGQNFIVYGVSFYLTLIQ